MKKYIWTLAACALFCFGTAACGDDEKIIEEPPQENPVEDDDKDEEEEEPGKDEEEKPEPVVFITSIDQLNQSEESLNSHADDTRRSQVKMNFRTYTEVPKSELVEPNQQYPRIKKMADGRYIMFYQKGASKSSGIGQRCHWAISEDLIHWEHKGNVFTKRTLTTADGEKINRYYANCDAVVLKNGDILAVASYRGDKYKEDTQWDGVELRRSTDNGQTWGDYQEIYKGGINWEPYIIELASGEIHCYFTDSNRTGEGGHGQDTGVALVTSSDGGLTWNPTPQDEFYAPYYVLRMAWQDGNTRRFNHQMPCIIQLNNSNELAAAMESHPGGKDYHISMAYSGEDGQWEHLAVDQEGPEDSENMQFLGSAPYLIQFPSGETLLSYNRGGYHLKMGDARARNFEETPYDPFKSSSFWGSLCLLDSHRAIGTIPHGSNESILVAQFILNHRIQATERNVLPDGDNQEWKPQDHALFIGDQTQAQATLRAAQDDGHVYFLAEVLDRNLNRSASDYVSLYISPLSADNTLGNGAFRINISTQGVKSIEAYDNGKWVETQKDITVETTICDRPDLPSDGKGYIAEIAIPREMLNIQEGELLVNYSITRNYAVQDALADHNTNDTSRWIPVSGL